MSTAGDILLTADGDEILTAAGDSLLVDGTGDTCCCGGSGCSACLGDDCTACAAEPGDPFTAPARFTVSFVNILYCACFDFDNVFAKSVAPSGAFGLAGTYTLTQNGCKWEYRLAAGIGNLDVFDDHVCGALLATVATHDLYIYLERYTFAGSVYFDLRASVQFEMGGVTWTETLFRADQVFAATCCEAVAFTDDIAVALCAHSTGQMGYGGSAVVTPC